VNGKQLIRRSDDGLAVEFRDVGFDERELLIAAEPDVFYLPPDKQGSRLLFARLVAIEPAQLMALVQRRWRTVAPRLLVKAVGRATT
jgi:hypothetical protein